MRIIGGRFGGRALASVAGHKTRPTAERTREALFSILQSAEWCALGGVRVIDVFAGTGALGLEALSRGAASCLFVEQNKQACAAIHTNIAALHLEEDCQIHRRDACRLDKRPATMAPFRLALIDPPYGKGYGERALAGLLRGGWLADDAVRVLEEEKRSDIAAPSSLMLHDTRIYSDTQLLFYGVAL